MILSKIRVVTMEQKKLIASKKESFEAYFWKSANQKRKLLQADESAVVRQVLWGIKTPADMSGAII